MTTAPVNKWIEGISPADRTIDVAVRSLQARLAAVEHFLPLAVERAEGNVEHVHHLRVWARRAAAALNLYADLLPRRRATWLRTQLRRLRRAANDARDYDVLAQRLAQTCSEPVAAGWLKKVQAQRTEAQKPLVAIYERLKRNDRFERRIAKVLCRVRPRRTKKHGQASPLFGDWARGRLRPIVKSFFAAAPLDGAKMAALHRFRIRGKKLRYAMELLAGAFPPDFREKLYPKIEILQEKLGAINDLATAQVRLRHQLDLAEERAKRDHLKKLLADEKGRLKQARQDLMAWFTAEFQEDLEANFGALLAQPAHCDERVGTLVLSPAG